jgi:hypothetical protein
MLLAISLMASERSFKSLTKFELILIYSIRQRSNFILYLVEISFHNHILKMHPFFYCVFLGQFCFKENMGKGPKYTFFQR